VEAGGGGHPEGGGSILSDPPRFGLWLFLATVTMLFLGFTSAYMLRRGGGDWRALPVPGWLWVSTALLLASDATLEISRRRLRGFDVSGATRWLGLTGALGAAFVAAQLGGWRSLVGAGYFLATNPHNSFFYVLTGLHGLHVLSALIWFGVVYYQARALTLVPGSGRDGLRLFATFWHYLAGLWVYLLVLLFAF
jgi:cytochrome c oxidase subunit 3